MTVIPNASLLCTHLLQRMIRDLIKIFLNLIFYVINKFCSVINLRGFFFYTGNFLLGSTPLTNQKPGFPRFRCLPQLHCYATALQPFQSLLLTTRKVFLQKKKTSENQKSFCELHWIRTSDPRLKRALLYLLS